jgi:hypothetical protein
MDSEGRWTDKGMLFDVHGEEPVRRIIARNAEIFKSRTRTDAGYRKQLDAWNQYMEGVYLGYKIGIEQGRDL